MQEVRVVFVNTWTEALEAIKNAKEGDVIICDDE